MCIRDRDELEDIDTDKVIRMCLLHDIGEAAVSYTHLDVYKRQRQCHTKAGYAGSYADCRKTGN